MSIAMQKMWISIAGMGLMAIAVLAIYLSRYKLKGILKYLLATIAYVSMFIAAIIMVIIIVSGPTNG
ncbi:DUF2768 domain-containing protein [Pradoshia sp. D12]|uniref:DUF2768 domain-containing protein n=1 Tax=Bacillaceae TaxID=186817 RepID=UPI00080ACADB|nr:MULTISPECIES: DUF2768 domain-containing protein [Bacillaceae]OCA83576.1 hypothetical protein A8L44_12160 [Bacillus sp. FJAT-27986]QFK71817.1 DUF2768 domain-containing protein [Pradoshia sp. D12]TPF73612.1 DUF2768 domain-containing protein [Bacillus sp. D12]